jgi:folate-dependent tRNA-U54 methylase TrmFO/GidA
MNANFGLLDPLEPPAPRGGKIKKDRKKELLVERARADFASWRGTL